MNTIDKNMEIVAQPQSSTQATSETKDILHNHSDTETPELTNEDMAEKENKKSKTSLFKRILPVALLDVGLPSLDVYSDLSLIIGWFASGSPKFALAMCVPLFLQNLATIYKWYEIEKPESKKWSWLLLLGQCWPQFRALKVIRLMYQNNPKANKKKRKLMADVGSTEPYLESWPSVLIMTIIFVYSLPNRARRPNEMNEKAVFGTDNTGEASFTGFIWFLVSYAISILTASLGVTKLLVIGPCPVIRGLCTWRFILCFLSVMTSILTKGLFMAAIIVTGGSNMLETCSLFVLQIIPNVILSFFFIVKVTGCRKKFTKILADFPGLWLLPVATFFTIGYFKENKLGFSKKCSIINMIVTVAMYGITLGLSTLLPRRYGSWLDDGYTKYFGIIFTPVLLITLLLNVTFLLLDTNCCCNYSRSCIPKMCCGPSCYSYTYHYIDTTNEIEIWKYHEDIEK